MDVAGSSEPAVHYRDYPSGWLTDNDEHEGGEALL